MLQVLLTGAAGFIGSHVAHELLSRGIQVIGIDNFDPFYSYEQKYHNLEALIQHPSFVFHNLDILDEQALQKNLSHEKIDVIIHLAARAGVRPSIEKPIAYLQSNVIGTQHLLELAKEKNIRKFIFASSSSVYGNNPNYPWAEDSSYPQPISPYAASKISSELMGQVYSHLYAMQFLALRFFTVYGPAQRPDLAIHKFFHKAYKQEQVPIFGKGNSLRDYTYVSDIVSGICACLKYEDSKFEVINLGNNQPISLIDLLQKIEHTIGKKLNIQHLPEQPGDVEITFANIDKAKRLLGYEPKISMDEGLNLFHNWYQQYYQPNRLAPLL